MDQASRGRWERGISSAAEWTPESKLNGASSVGETEEPSVIKGSRMLVR
ncbi:MAG: hypothetical protein IKP40_12320 [Clostridia bacterium]|nr:hypothetical protein [Clostridia bacterium]